VYLTLGTGEQIMSKEKQIEEMAKALMDAVNEKHGHISMRVLAESIYNAGYRKQSAVIDEFVERLKEQPIKCGLPMFGLSTKDEIEEYFNGIMLQVRDAIDSIAEAMKGENK
jgi:hypothetical protein